MGVAGALAVRAERGALVRGAILATAFVFGAWIRLVFLPSAGSWDLEYWKAWTARADAAGVARVYGDADAVPSGHFLAQLRGAEPLWLVPYRGRDFVVDYPPLAMALWPYREFAARKQDVESQYWRVLEQIPKDPKKRPRTRKRLVNFLIASNREVPAAEIQAVVDKLTKDGKWKVGSNDELKYEL